MLWRLIFLILDALAVGNADVLLFGDIVVDDYNIDDVDVASGMFVEVVLSSFSCSMN